MNMSTAEKIFEKTQTLPDEAQHAVLQIVELLAQKPAGEDEDWTRFSLSLAMKGLEGESWPDYTAASGFEKWQ